MNSNEYFIYKHLFSIKLSCIFNLFLDPEMDDFVDTDSNRQRKVAQPPKEDSLAYHLPGGDVLVAAAGPHRMRLPKKQSVPKIYFGTRTHKQVSQIIRNKCKLILMILSFYLLSTYMQCRFCHVL